VTAVPSDAGVRERVLSLAASGAWADVCVVFDAELAGDGCGTELANIRGEALIRSGRPREAREWLASILPAIERRGDPAGLRRAVNLFGAASFETGELQDAEVAFERALALGRNASDDLLVAHSTNNLGAIANVRGERDRALAMYALAIAAYQHLGQPRGLAHAYHNMGITFRQSGMLDRADEHERRAIEYALDAENPHLLSLARIGRAEISLLRGDARLAEATATIVAREFAGRSDPIQQANALRVVGAARLALADRAGARDALGTALDLARGQGGALIEAEILRTGAELDAAEGDLRRARASAADAVAIFERLDARDDQERLRTWIARLDSRITDP
jgi:tetratricopeptide (TPR) repeat protein